MKKLNSIARIHTGVFAKETDNANALYLQLGDFDEYGTFRGGSKPSVFMDRKAYQHILLDNDLLFAAKGSNNICITVPDVGQLCVASPSFLVIRITDKSVLPEYLCWYLNLPSTRRKLVAQGTGIMSIRKSSLGELEIPIPSLERQRVCAELAKLQKREHQLYKAIAEKRSLILECKMIKAYKNE